jgi:CHAT domain-containing protein
MPVPSNSKYVVQGLAWLLAISLCSSAWAQADEIEQNFKKLDPAQEKTLRDVLAQPVPQGASLEVLRRHFNEKSDAASKLSDTAQRQQVLRQAIKVLPDAELRNNLARELLSTGQINEGNEMMQQAIAAAQATQPSTAAFYRASAACDLVSQYKTQAALSELEAAYNSVQANDALATAVNDKANLQRALGRVFRCKSLMDVRQGRRLQAMESAHKALLHGKQALALHTNPRAKTFIQIDIADSMARKIQAHIDLGQMQDAELALSEYLRYARDVQLPPLYLSGIYTSAANLRFYQREFAAAEALARSADEVMERLNYDRFNTIRVARQQDILIMMIGQKKWAQAQLELDHIDALAGGDTQLKNRVSFSTVRGMVHFGNRRFEQAAPMFERAANVFKASLGESHFFVLQWQGLQAAALWHTGDAAQRARALPMLKKAVQGYMSAEHADYLDNIGYRKERREEIFTAYLEAISTTPGEDANQALAQADWIRSSLVQDALSDAAARSAVANPELAAMVRQDQDAKNEMVALRNALAGEGGRAPAGDAATLVRNRLTQLAALRQNLQGTIKAQFPDYDSLVRPNVPSVAQLASQLGRDQALVLLQPTQNAVYVWALAKDRPASFTRAALPLLQVNAMVARLRQDLDLGAMSKAPTTYDSATAFALYDKLLAPVASTWQGKPQLIVAAAGALSQLPFAVLHTASGGGVDTKAPWLVHQTAITQVPSVSAWLALQSIAKARGANESFAGWGDPVFSLQAKAPPPARAVAARSVSVDRGPAVADLGAAASPTPSDSAPSALRYSDLAPLPDTRDELQAIAKILSANNTRDVVLGGQATRESVMNASRSGTLLRKKVLAFATHGLMAGDLPNLTQPALALAVPASGMGANPLAALLTLEDVLTLKLNADWVVLSACNTAAADGKAEEALSGLARGFFYAGSRSLLVTHWSVESASATLLTTATFEHYVKNPSAPKAESLRFAMRHVMAIPKYNHPAFWAPYALVGDGGR